MNTTLPPASDNTLGMDYKHFIRHFETYRQTHPEYSFQQAMDAFLALHQQKKPASKASQ
jgi:hypothetical protein